jgi:hypothetical protein
LRLVLPTGRGAVFSTDGTFLFFKEWQVREDVSSTVRVEVSSPPDREHLVANIMIEAAEFAEINQEEGALQVEIYPRQDGEPWRLSYSALTDAMNLAKERLEGTRS